MVQRPPVQRHTSRPFPAYRYVPGRTPHPRRDSDGHSHGAPEPEAAGFDAGRWQQDKTYLYAIDLFNAGYWWEAHEGLEALWHAAGHDSPAGRFLQALIFVAAAQLQRLAGRPQQGRTLARKALRRLAEFSGGWFGIEVGDLAGQVEHHLLGEGAEPVVLLLR